MSDVVPNSGGGMYDRPNQPWVCGRAAEGDPCAFGPGAGGICHALAECKPVEVAGQWKCDRPATRGGPCADGPTPEGECCRSHACRPVRSLRSLRGAIAKSVAVFAVGAVLMVLGSSWRNQWLAPGPLTSHHTQVLHGAGWNDRCSSCHAAAEQTPGAWLTALVAGQVGPTQSSKCLACHDKTIDPNLALVAHNVPLNDLATLGPHGHAAGGKWGDLACAICHQEHHGTMHSIAAMDNTRCQTCHAQQFESFAGDHPEFGLWPHARRTPIAFSHATHSGKHFAEKQRPFDCAQCHVEDASRGVQLTLGYEAACAECHEADIETSTIAGVSLLTMPSLDVEALAEAGSDVGDWPQHATGDFDGKLPAMTLLLVSQDKKARAAIDVLGADFDFFDVDPDDNTQLRAAGDVAMAIQRLLDSLTTNPGEVSQSVLRGLPASVVAAARGNWTSDQTDDGGDESLDAQRGTWFADNASLSIRYRPTGHADAVLKSWIDAAVAEPDRELRDALLAEFTGPGAPGRCTTCHSIEAVGERVTIHWQAHDRRQEPRGFTRFSHTPHLLPAELRNCTACHAINTAADTSGNYTGHNPAAFVSDFHPITKANCASCHNKGAVGESCTQCHNYHVEAW